MTLVHFDEPDAHVDTDAAGEPCVVVPDRRRSIANVLVANEIKQAYAANPTCYVCAQRIELEADAAFLSTRGRVVHAHRCLSQFLYNAFRFRRPSRMRIDNDDDGADLEREFLEILNEAHKDELRG